MTDTSGPPSPAPLAFYDPSSSSWRTSQATFLSDSTPSSVTLPAWGTTHGGALYERSTPALVTVDPGCLLLPTPTAQESDPTEEYVEAMRDRFDPEARMYLPGRKWHAQRTLSRVASMLGSWLRGDATPKPSPATPPLSVDDPPTLWTSETSSPLASPNG